jgi:hypothetical protein
MLKVHNTLNFKQQTFFTILFLIKTSYTGKHKFSQVKLCTGNKYDN